MENKSNEATAQRSESDRILNANRVDIDLNLFIEQLCKETRWKESDRNSITIFKSDKMRIVLLGLHKGAELVTHTANGMISVQVLEGKIDFITSAKTGSLQKGQMIVLHEKIPHSVVALEESFFLLTLAMS